MRYYFLLMVLISVGVSAQDTTIHVEGSDLSYIGQMVDGKKEGLWKLISSNGMLVEEGSYAGDQKTGEWKGYYENGQLKEVVTYSKNLENGPFKEYHKNGKLKTEGTYRDGDNEDGLLKEYDETGTLVKKKECKMGVCKTIWAKDMEDKSDR